MRELKKKTIAKSLLMNRNLRNSTLNSEAYSSFVGVASDHRIGKDKLEAMKKYETSNKNHTLPLVVSYQ